MSIKRGIFNDTSNFEARFISDYPELKQCIESLKVLGQKIVLTQGVYDLVHEGHALYLEKAAAEGDILVVGVDSDRLTQERKGPNRPIVPEAERLKMLVHLRHVDIVTLRHSFEDGLIEIVRPDVLIVSETTEDLSDERIKEWEEVCGKVVKLPPQATTSTTARIRQLAISGAVEMRQELLTSIDSFISKLRGDSDGQLAESAKEIRE
jgi:D-beta-D-heptose 7-phosphate kinase/D-beta-D-heptose 1-phosphate adenosyltransferase